MGWAGPRIGWSGHGCSSYGLVWLGYELGGAGLALLVWDGPVWAALGMDCVGLSWSVYGPSRAGSRICRTGLAWFWAGLSWHGYGLGWPVYGLVWAVHGIGRAAPRMGSNGVGWLGWVVQYGLGWASPCMGLAGVCWPSYGLGWAGPAKCCAGLVWPGYRLVWSGPGKGWDGQV
jgi:hypothetical protein